MDEKIIMQEKKPQGLGYKRRVKINTGWET